MIINCSPDLNRGQSTLVKQLLFLFLVSISLMSCLSNKRLDKWVAKHYSESQQPQKKNSRNVNNNYLTVTTTMISMGDLYSTSQKTNSYLLPLLFYWKFDFRNSCTLNPQIGIDNFTTTVLAYANKKD